MTSSFAFKLVAACATCVCAGSAFSHIVLAEPAALAGTSYRATLRVGHGCGDAPTTAIRVLVPAGMTGAQPMPKAGWTLSTVVGPLAQPYSDHGKPVTEGVTEIRWTASSPESALPSAYYDEFVLRGGLPRQAGPMWFKVLQTCAQGAIDWAEVPAAGQSAHGLKAPAALLDIIPSDAVGHAH